MSTNDGCRADVRKARAEAARVDTSLTDAEWTRLRNAAGNRGDLGPIAEEFDRILADRLATDTAAPEDAPFRFCKVRDGVCSRHATNNPDCMFYAAPEADRHADLFGSAMSGDWCDTPAAPVAVEGVETVETLAEVLTDLRVPNPLASGADNDMEMSGIYDWDELQRFAAALEPILAARIVQARAGEGALREGSASVLAISSLIDASYPATVSVEAHRWRRCVKVAEEIGEVTEALLGLEGENPRKGITHTLTDVRKELLDVALAALGAVAHLDGNNGDPIAALSDHAAVIETRLRAALTTADPS